MHMSHPAEREIAGQVEREVRSKETENRSNKFVLAALGILAGDGGLFYKHFLNCNSVFRCAVLGL